MHWTLNDINNVKSHLRDCLLQWANIWNAREKANKAIHDKVPDKRVNQGGHKLSKNSAHWVRYEHETSSSAANSGRLKLDDTVCCIRP